MGYDFFSQPQGPNIDVNLFPNAMKAGADVGNSIPSQTSAIINGLLSGVKTGESLVEGYQKIQDNQHTIDQYPTQDALDQQKVVQGQHAIDRMPVTDQIQDTQLTRDQAAAKVDTLNADFQQNNQALIDAKKVADLSVQTQQLSQQSEELKANAKVQALMQAPNDDVKKSILTDPGTQAALQGKGGAEILSRLIGMSSSTGDPLFNEEEQHRMALQISTIQTREQDAREREVQAKLDSGADDDLMKAYKAVRGGNGIVRQAISGLTPKQIAEEIQLYPANQKKVYPGTDILDLDKPDDPTYKFDPSDGYIVARNGVVLPVTKLGRQEAEHIFTLQDAWANTVGRGAKQGIDLSPSRGVDTGASRQVAQGGATQQSPQQPGAQQTDYSDPSHYTPAYKAAAAAVQQDVTANRATGFAALPNTASPQGTQPAPQPTSQAPAALKDTDGSASPPQYTPSAPAQSSPALTDTDGSIPAFGINQLSTPTDDGAIVKTPKTSGIVMTPATASNVVNTSSTAIADDNAAPTGLRQQMYQKRAAVVSQVFLQKAAAAQAGGSNSGANLSSTAVAQGAPTAANPVANVPDNMKVVTSIKAQPNIEAIQRVASLPEAKDFSAITKAVMVQESAGVNSAVSGSKVKGLMQVTKGTATEISPDLKREDAQASVYMGAVKLEKLMADPSYGNNTMAVLTAYNAGEGVVSKAISLAKEAGLTNSTDWNVIKAYIPAAVRSFDTYWKSLGVNTEDKVTETSHYAEKVIANFPAFVRSPKDMALANKLKAQGILVF